MKSTYAIALATTVALVGASFTVPNTQAQTTTTTQAPVAGLSWPEGKVAAGGKTTIAPNQTPAADLRFTGGGKEAGYNVSTDEKTGVVTVEAPLNAPPGYKFTIPVSVFKGEEKVGTYEVTAHITEGGDAASYSPSYDDIAVPEGQTATATLKGKVPAGTKFEVSAPELFTAKVDEQGTVSVTPNRNLAAGTTAVVRVIITYPDTSIEYRDINVKVTQPTTTPAKPTLTPRTTIPGPTTTRTDIATTIELTVTNTPSPTTKEGAAAGTTEPSASNGSSTGEAIAIVLTSLAVLGGMAALLGWWALESGIITL